MYLITYEVEEGNNYAGGWVLRQKAVETLEEAFKLPHVKLVQEIEIKGELPLDEFEAAQKAEEARQERARSLREAEALRQRAAAIERGEE